MISRRARLTFAVPLALSLATCTPRASEGPRVVDAESAPSAATDGAVVSLDAGPAAEPLRGEGAQGSSPLLLSERALMATLDASGYDLGTLLGDGPARDGAALARGARYRDLAAVIASDVAEAKRKDPSSGVGLAFGHRLFDVRLLRDRDARWELVGVSQRFDRDFADATRCGELRFIYRLRYDKVVKGLPVSSRMPQTAAISFWNERGSDSGAERCASALRDWTVRVADASKPRLPSAAELAPRFKAVELNVQTVRWPSTVRPDMAGHAEYALRALVRSEGGAHLVPGPLENTPDVARARGDRSYARALEAWVTDPANAARIDAGTAILPPPLSATRATSVTPHGLARRHNRPFRTLLEPSRVHASASAALARSGEAVLRRLDEMSCPGCHASRSIAGFHFLGEETAPLESVNAVLVGRSPHLIDELARRGREVARRLTGRGEPTAIPFAERTSARGEAGSRCGLGPDPSFASWTCEEGLVCARDVGSEHDGVGVCTRPSPRAGDRCEVGRLAPSSDPLTDRVARLESSACPGACNDNRVGFPGGACVASCASLGEGEVCGAIPRLTGFNDCLARSKGSSFEQCILDNATASAVQACDERRPCRDDYICARTREGKGACMPPYFLFQLRVDGHP